MRPGGLATLMLGLVCGGAFAAPFNVRAGYAEGQVFVVWQNTGPVALPTDTVEIYASASPQADTSLMTLVGRLFCPEYTGARLQPMLAGATLRVPTPGGGTYQLAADEGAFAFTPHAAGTLFFAVVESGATAVGPANSDTVTFSYDPVNDPVRAHWQFSGTTFRGNPFDVWVVWVDGRDDHTDGRPDFPVMANRARNGVPHVFVTAEPLTPLPPGPLSCVLALHGGGGNYQLFLPGASLHENRGLQMTDGIVVAPDDSVYYQDGSDLVNRITMWLGYVESFDPFTSAPRDLPPDGSLIVNYTQRRVFWILDWLEHGINSPYSIDPERIAIISHSGGARGASHISRSHPERFCGVVLHNPGFNLSAGSGVPDPLAGSVTQNLATTLSDPNGNPAGLADVYDPTFRLTATPRDLAFTRAYFGKRDTSQSATWDADMRTVLDAMDAARLGYAISWDEREHPVGEWHTEDPAIPGPDIAQWIAPVQSERPTGQYLVDHYRASQSYPGFFNVDLDALTPGRQPDPGNGDDPNDGDQFGTWGGYLEWDPNTLVDQPDRWECTMFATGLSAVSIDNCPVPQLVADMAPRKTQAFVPSAGRRMRWRSSDAASGTLLQSGVSIADAEGVTIVSGLVVPRDPDRVHVVIEPCPQTIADVAACMLGPDAGASSDCECLDDDGDGDIDLADVAAWQVDLPDG